jgi:hypothetical protein
MLPAHARFAVHLSPGSNCSLPETLILSSFRASVSPPVAQLAKLGMLSDEKYAKLLPAQVT